MKRMWAFVFIAAGLALLVYGINLVRDAKACGSWPQAEGRVISAEVETVAREKNKTTYAPSVSYTFSVAGREFKGSRFTLVPRNSISQQTIQSMLSPYPVGGNVRVFYDPRDPSNCVLSTATNGAEWAYAIGGALMLGVGLLSLRQK